MLYFLVAESESNFLYRVLSNLFKLVNVVALANNSVYLKYFVGYHYLFIERIDFFLLLLRHLLYHILTRNENRFKVATSTEKGLRLYF